MSSRRMLAISAARGPRGPNAGNIQGGRATEQWQINRVVKDLGLNKSQRDLLHRAITKMDYTIDEIIKIAMDIVETMPKGGRGK